ncbi:HlyD family secretion protein [Microbulbifer sp. YPW1]|uniref:HlyD family secretion protein n=1 Tax=Microbulbifer sp. YPW1 TaxID=2745199 RepID=UPI001597A242|nr:HlyD family efflux transporter periplasmic adaptor subunit [Microbulbifer sp. YPW1]QKX18608.1 HlyD family efflux transporter periplasmic adaptor subunit [Microbulbifer sp. YPW1]
MRKMAALLTLLLTACCGEEITETAHRSARTSILPIAGELESARSVMVAPPAIDRMWQYSIKRMVPENSQVAEGEVVVAFDDKAVRERLIEKKSELKQWRSELNNTLLKEKQTAKDDILAIEEKRAEFEKAERRAKILDQSMSRIEREKAAIDFEIARNDLTLARKLAEMHKRTGELRISMARHKVARSEGEVAVLESEVEKLKVKASISGLVQYVANWKGEKPSAGESVRFGQPVLQISDLSQMRVRAQADEVDKAYLSIGTDVAVAIDGAEAVTLRGEILELGRVVRDRATGDRRRVVDLLVGLEETGGSSLKPGMTASLSLGDPAGKKLASAEEVL